MINCSEKYISFKVYTVIKLRNKYAFRIYLEFPNNKTKVIQKSGYETKKAANYARDEILGELYNGTFVIEKKTLVKDFSMFWLDDVMRKRITSDSYDAYKNIIKNHINKSLGDIKLSDLNTGHIQKFYNEKSIYSHSVSKLCKTVMVSMLKYAEEKSFVERNVAKGVNLPKHIKKSKYRTIEIDEKKTLNIEQLKLLIEKSKNTPIHLQVLFAGLMGLRKQEINGLKYSDIDYVHRTLKIERQLGKKANTNNEDLKLGEYTKQDIKVKTFSSQREMEIPDIVFEEIIAEKKKYEKNKNRRLNDQTNPFRDYNYIVCSSYGNPRSKAFHFTYWKKLLKDCNLPNIRFHDLRATYSTILLKNNFSPKAISKLMGHAHDVITVDVYGDNEEIISDCVDEIQSFIDDVKPNNGDNNNDLSDVSFCDIVMEQIMDFKNIEKGSN